MHKDFTKTVQSQPVMPQPCSKSRNCLFLFGAVKVEDMRHDHEEEEEEEAKISRRVLRFCPVWHRTSSATVGSLSMTLWVQTTCQDLHEILCRSMFLIEETTQPADKGSYLTAQTSYFGHLALCCMLPISQTKFLVLEKLTEKLG